MTAAEQRAAVEAHPPMLVTHAHNGDKHYDLREIALWILDNPAQAEYRLSDWWNARIRDTGPKWAQGSPVHFLGFELELAAYRLIAHASRGEVYAPADMGLVLQGGSPL